MLTQKASESTSIYSLSDYSQITQITYSQKKHHVQLIFVVHLHGTVLFPLKDNVSSLQNPVSSLETSLFFRDFPSYDIHQQSAIYLVLVANLTKLCITTFN